MRLFFLCLILFLKLIGYSMAVHKSPCYVQLAGEIQNEMADILSKRYKMGVIADYVALFDRVNGLGLSFQIQGPLSKGKLRYILIDCIQEYLCKINSEVEIRPYLKNYPFLPENLNIAIFVKGQKEENYEIFYPDIGLISSVSGNLYFKTYDPDNEFKYKTDEKETYEEALAIVKQQYPEFVDRCEEK